jgi:hypothetical protein
MLGHAERDGEELTVQIAEADLELGRCSAGCCLPREAV